MEEGRREREIRREGEREGKPGVAQGVKTELEKKEYEKNPAS